MRTLLCLALLALLVVLCSCGVGARHEVTAGTDASRVSAAVSEALFAYTAALLAYKDLAEHAPEFEALARQHAASLGDEGARLVQQYEPVLARQREIGRWNPSLTATSAPREPTFAWHWSAADVSVGADPGKLLAEALPTTHRLLREGEWEAAGAVAYVALAACAETEWAVSSEYTELQRLLGATQNWRRLLRRSAESQAMMVEVSPECAAKFQPVVERLVAPFGAATCEAVGVADDSSRLLLYRGLTGIHATCVKRFYEVLHAREPGLSTVVPLTAPAAQASVLAD